MAPDAIFHSDRGTHYTSREMGAWCTGNGVRQSMGATGVCWDNAVAESAFSSLKNEFYHHHSFTARVPFPASDVLVPSGLPDQSGLQGDRAGSPAWTKARTSTPCVAPTSRT
ncbi:MAG: transposase [Schumannella sp.]|nr:transposase [Schumannella sp.]